MKSKPSITQRLYAFLGSRRFWAIILGVFIFQSAWIALTARYPQAFDEQFHFGIIKLYAHHLSPFWDGQPTGAGQYGALTRDPSYLYQYLMSFPYRLISALTASQTTQIIVLRLLNVGMLAAAILVFRRVLRQLGASDRISNVVMAFFILTPVVPLLGAQINYDNLFILATALLFSTYLRFRHVVHVEKVWKWSMVSQLLLLCLFGSLVKYAFLPFAVGLAVAVFFDWLSARKQNIRIVPKKNAVRFQPHIVLYAVLILTGSALFCERYIVNTLAYHTPIPECDQVLSVDECQDYAPWARNYMFAGWHLHLTKAQIATYPFVWIHRALAETVFAVTSRFNDTGTIDYFLGLQLPVTNVLSWVVFIGGAVLSIASWRYLRRNKPLLVLLGTSAFYVLVLFLQNYSDYLHLALPVAIHGRYLLPLLPLLYLCIALSLSQLLQIRVRPTSSTLKAKAWLAAILLLVFALEGGGFTTMIVRSDEAWFWQQSRPAQLANQYAQDFLKYIVIR